MGNATRSRSRARARQSARTGALEVFIRPQQTLIGRIAGLLVRLRVELTVGIIALLAYIWLTSMVPPLAIGIAAAVLLVMLAAIPATRRFVTRRYWCVFTRHRVRTCFEQTRTVTHNGRMPFLMWARPTPVGERVRVWLPAGLSVKDIEKVSDELAAACWGRAARVEPDKCFAASVFVQIVRRDPLQDSALSPDVLDHVEPVEDDGTVVPLPSRDQVAGDVTSNSAVVAEPIEHTQPARKPARGQSKKTTPQSKASADEPDPESRVQGFGGMDVTDYV